MNSMYNTCSFLDVPMGSYTRLVAYKTAKGYPVNTFVMQIIHKNYPGCTFDIHFEYQQVGLISNPVAQNDYNHHFSVVAYMHAIGIPVPIGICKWFYPIYLGIDPDWKSVISRCIKNCIRTSAARRKMDSVKEKMKQYEDNWF